MNENENEKEIEERLSELKEIINPKSFLDKADLMQYCIDLINSIVLKEDFLYYNDNTPKFSLRTTKTSIVYKIMFDSSNESTLIFNDGFHVDAFDKDYVIESFRKFALRVFDKDESKIPLILVSKDRYENLYKNLSISKFFKEALLLQDAIDSREPNSKKQVFSIYNYGIKSHVNKSLEIKPQKENGTEIGMEYKIFDAVKAPVEDLVSFSIFDGKYYRVEKNKKDKNGEAYVNFGDLKGSKILLEYFNFLKNNTNNEDITSLLKDIKND